MEFCILSPVAGLNRYSTLSKTHLVLAHLNNPKYIEFYQRRAKAGDFLILDNGAYERKFNPSELLQKIRVYSPNVVVLPDHYLQAWDKTWYAASGFLDRWYESYPNVQWMYVPQATAGDIVGWVEGLVKALQDERIGWIGLPRVLGTDISVDPLIRANVCRYVKRRGKKVHALGMLAGSVSEIKPLENAGCDSIDSNAPVWRGMCGYSIAHGRWAEIPVEYDFDFPEEKLGYDLLTLDNLEACGVDTSARR